MTKEWPRVIHHVVFRRVGENEHQCEGKQRVVEVDLVILVVAGWACACVCLVCGKLKR